jgi:type I restriction enzyme M protein
MPAPAAKPTAIIVQQGKILDFIDGATQRPETPEEYVRQEIAKSLVREYGYAKKDIAVELTIPVGTRRPRADLVVFQADAPHSPADARIIVECKAKKVKADDRAEGVGQLQSYLAVCLNAEWGMWTNGEERFCFRKVVEGKKPATFEEVPDIPAFGKSDEETDRPLFDQLKPAASDALMFAFRRCHNRIAGSQGLHKEGAFWELLKLIFCKIHDERASDEVQFYAGARERHGSIGQMKVVARIGQLFTTVKTEYPGIFEQAEPIRLEPALLVYIVGQLQMYSLLDSDVDVKGHAYEEIVGDNLRGDRGEFFTPRNVCRMAVAMLDPHEDDMIVDPACGTGGFLITAMNHVIDQIVTAEEKKWKDGRAEKAIRARVSKFAKTHIVGIDFNPALVRATKMNMVMNNDGEGGLFQGNSLQSPGAWSDALRARNLLGRVDILFTNPPFGANIEIGERSILEQFDLGHQWSYDAATDQWTMSKSLQKSQPPEILFVERCVRFLKPGTGRAAIVVPDGILGAPGLGYVREWILSHARVLASIDLHPDTFQPRTSVQTSLLVLQRKTAEQVALEKAAGRKKDYEVFMALANHIGHDKRGITTYVRDAKGFEVVEETEESVKEYDDNNRIIYRTQTSRRKVVDDNTLQIAQAFRQWYSEQG